MIEVERNGEIIRFSTVKEYLEYTQYLKGGESAARHMHIEISRERKEREPVSRKRSVVKGVFDVAKSLENQHKEVTCMSVADALGIRKTKKNRHSVTDKLQWLKKKGLLFEACRSKHRGKMIYYSTVKCKKVVPEKAEQPHKFMRGSSEYTKFLSARLKHYMNEPYRYPIDKARAIVAQEWQARKGKIRIPTETVEWPSIECVNKKDEDLLISVTKNVIGTKSSITYFNEGKMLGLDESAKWKEFVIEFMNHSKQIADYFGVQNKFKIEQIGNQARIVYS